MAPGAVCRFSPNWSPTARSGYNVRVMAIRYSGDTEIRIRYAPAKQTYEGTVTDPYLQWRGSIRLPARHYAYPTDPAAYDVAARALIAAAETWAKGQRRVFSLQRKGTRTRIRRVFQAPCPLE